MWEVGLVISREKTKAMVRGRKLSGEKLNSGDNKTERVETFRYLGVIFDNERKMADEV